jgi:hypothetical protein
MEHQDWTTVTVRGRKPKPNATVERNGAAAVEARRLYKLETEETVPVKKRLTADSKAALVAARLAIKKAQRDVDKDLAFPPNTIRDFEAGTVVPKGQQISALHRYYAASKLSLKLETY